MYLTPDERFLSRELMDSMIDLAAGRAIEAAEMVAQLTKGDFPVLGDRHGAHTVVLFSDFQCPFCKEEANVVSELSELSRSLPGVRVIFRNLPLPVHDWAQFAAEMASCVFEQDNKSFWWLGERLFLRQERLSAERLGDEVDDFVKHASFR